MAKRAQLPATPSGTYEGVDIVGPSGSPVLSIDDDGANILGVVDVDEAAGSLSASVSVNVGAGTTIKTQSMTVSGASTSRTVINADGTGRVNYYRGATSGSGSSFTHAESALRVRDHPNALTVYFGGISGKTVGDPVTWEVFIDASMTATTRTVDILADVTADTLGAPTISAGSTVSTPVVSYTPVAAASVPNNSDFVDSADGLKSFKDAGGVVRKYVFAP